MSGTVSILRVRLKTRPFGSRNPTARQDAKPQKIKVVLTPLRLGVRRGFFRQTLRSVLLAGVLLLSMSLAASGRELRLLFTGDILLSRQVQAEIQRTRRSPWDGWPPIFPEADWVLGNLEGAVGVPADCLSTSARSPCFAMPDSALALLRQAGFRALGTANNHRNDLGEAARHATRQRLRQEGLGALSFEDSPSFWRSGDITLGVVAFSTVAGPDRQRVEVPSPVLRQKLRLAKRLANLVVVYVHWGSELLEWPNAEQRRAAQWLVGQGADLIIGHHPHVVQPFECIQGKPVFYSLGNHLFDQKYPATKEGIIADCRVNDGRLTCGVIATRTPAGSAFPQVLSEKRDAAVESSTLIPPRGGNWKPQFLNSTRLALPMDEAALKACTATLGPGFTVAGYTLRPVPANPSAPSSDAQYLLEAVKDGKVRWKTRPVRLLSIDAGPLAGPDGPEMLVTLERHRSPFDHEDSPRPYVYEVTPRGLVAKWRGTALAWPLLDGALLPGETGILCALHRGDSYLVPDPQTPHTRVAAYRWNGFGFSGADDPVILDPCAGLFDLNAFHNGKDGGGGF